MKLFLTLIAATALLLSLQGSPEAAEKSGAGFRFSSTPGIKNIAPDRPPRVKLKRATTGKYSWEISGDDTKKVIEEDRKLRNYIDSIKK